MAVGRFKGGLGGLTVNDHVILDKRGVDLVGVNLREMDGVGKQ